VRAGTSILVVGSVTYFSEAVSSLTDVEVVAVVGGDVGPSEDAAFVKRDRVASSGWTGVAPGGD
jgi:hypothetical protein